MKQKTDLKKKKYEKPTLTELGRPTAMAQGFGTMGTCSTGTDVGDPTYGNCSSGFLPDSYDGSCGSGSIDTDAGSVCSGGSDAGTLCDSGSFG